MAISNGDILRAAFRFTNTDAGDVVNVFHFLVVDRGTEETYTWLDALAKNVLNKYADYMANVPNEVTSTDVKFDRVAWVGGKEVVQESFGIIDEAGYSGGTSANDPLPTGTSPMVQWRTSGVKTLARKYLPPTSENDQSAGTIGAAIIADMVTFLNHFLADIVMTGGVDGTVRAVVHSFRGGAWVPFISGVVKTVIAYQRRRKRYVGS